jgi:hypothetical protein
LFFLKRQGAFLIRQKSLIGKVVEKNSCLRYNSIIKSGEPKNLMVLSVTCYRRQAACLMLSASFSPPYRQVMRGVRPQMRHGYDYNSELE